MNSRKLEIRLYGDRMWRDFYEEVAYGAHFRIKQSVQDHTTFQIHILVNQKIRR